MTNSKQGTKQFQPLEAIEAFMSRFVAFSDDAHPRILSLWVLHTWLFESAYATPYMYVNSAEPQSGKTRVMEVALLLARNPSQASNITTSALFSKIGNSYPTVFIDEVDTIFDGTANNDLRGVLNSGYKKGAFVERNDGRRDEEGNREVSRFPTFCPKMLVGIDNAGMPDTLQDRCIFITLKRKKAGQNVERFVPRKVEPEAEELRAQIEQWATQNMERILDIPEPDYIDGISDRSFEIAEPLLILARVCGREYVKPTREAIAHLLTGKKPATSLGIQALSAAREMMEAGQTDKIASAALAAHLKISTKKLGVTLAPYDVVPETLRFASGDKLKGYKKDSFSDAWERYL